MTRLQTIVAPTVSPQPLVPDSVIAGIGSCFAQDILMRFYTAGFQGFTNPTGIVYNAVSMAQAVRRAACKIPYLKDEFFQHNGLWCSWQHHGFFSDPSLDAAIERANSTQERFRRALCDCELFVMTPSTSVVYEHHGQVVSNCHKVANHEFVRKTLSVEENYRAITDAIRAARTVSRDCAILLSLSPVIHYPGDLVLNVRSKAQLLAAIHQCLEENENTYYFPAYEIMSLQLRDYRFYNEDMLHPSELARNIVIESFIDSWFTEEVHDILAESARQRRAAAHRPLHNRPAK